MFVTHDQEEALSIADRVGVIPTCLAKIGIVVPVRGDCGLGGHFASKARHGGSRRGYRQPAAHGVSLPAQPVLVAGRRVS